MANEHIRSAATNLQRAIQDVRDAQARIRGEIENAKRDYAKSIEKIHQQMVRLERDRNKSRTLPADKIAISGQLQKLQTQISTIQHDSEVYAAQRQQEITMFDGQAIEFEGLADHLQRLA